MKRTLLFGLALMLAVSPVAAQDSGTDGQGGFLQGFGDFVSGIAGSGVNLSSQVVGQLSETINAGQASDALNDAVSRIGSGQNRTPDTGQDVRPSTDEENLIPGNVVDRLGS